ncbi:TPA: hypothetical protein P0E36_004888 [Vibrio harveyi]|nr:hypothetical protein [Vibrio harveyi]
MNLNHRTTQELLLAEALTSRVESAATQVITEGQKEIINPMPFIVAAAAKALTQIEDQELANEITNLLVESSAAASVNAAISEQVIARNNELETELSEINDKYAILLEERTLEEETRPDSEMIFLPPEEPKVEAAEGED